MATHHNQGAASAAPFDPAAWFAAWSDHGGIAMLIGERLWVGRSLALDRAATQRLNELRGYIGTLDAGNALAGLLRANSGEIA